MSGHIGTVGRTSLSVAMLIGLAVALLGGCSTVPRAYHPPRPIPPHEVSHADFDAVLRAHVKDGIVRYPAIAQDPRYWRYLDQLNRVDPTALATREERLAFWINAYNAFAIKGILDGYSPRTLFGRYRYFIAHEHAVGGETINLYNLEQRVLIPEFREPRIHFAIVCASLSCPKLQPWAYTPQGLDAQLDHSAFEFVNDLHRNWFEREYKIAYLSKIFEWFEEDFVAEAGSILAYVRRYVGDPVLADDLNQAPYTIVFREYDWSLNGHPPDTALTRFAPS